MKFVCYSFIALSFLSRETAASAQLAVHPIKKVPVSASDVLPRCTKSEFFGVASIGKNRSDIFLHYYSIPSRKRNHLGLFDSIEYMDLLQCHTISRQNKTFQKFNRINTINLMVAEAWPFENSGDSARFSVFAIWWLQPKEKRGPILVLTNQELQGDGSSGQYLLLSFPKGLSGKATLQVFGSGSNLNSFIQTTFDKIDERGFMIIDQWGGDMNNGQSTTYAARYFWNGEKFAVRK